MDGNDAGPVNGMNPEPPARIGMRGRVGPGLFAAAAAYFLWTEHRAHGVGDIPWGILAWGPWVHLDVHRGRGVRGHAQFSLALAAYARCTPRWIPRILATRAAQGA